MEDIQDLPMEVQVHIFQYPVDANLAEMMLNNRMYRGIAQEEIRYLEASNEGTLVSSKLILQLPNLVSVLGYIILIESLDDLLLLAEQQSLRVASFDLSRLGIREYGRLGLRESNEELRRTLTGEYYPSIESIENPRVSRFPLFDPYSMRPDNVANYIAYFILYRFKKVQPCQGEEAFVFRFYTRHRFLLELARGSIRTTPRGYFSEIKNILLVCHGLVDICTFTGIIPPNNALTLYLQNILYTLREIKLYTSHIGNLENMRTLFATGLENVSIYDPEKIRGNLEAYEGKILDFLEVGVSYNHVRSFVPVGWQSIADTLHLFPNLEEISYIHIPGEEIPWNLLMRKKKIILYTLDDVFYQGDKVQIINL